MVGGSGGWEHMSLNCGVIRCTRAIVAVVVGLCFILFGLEVCLLGKRNWENNLEKRNQKGNCEKRKGKTFHK